MYHFIVVPKINEFEDITAFVQNAVAESGVREGVCVVNVMNPNAALVLAQNGNGAALKDLEKELDRSIVPRVNYESKEEPYTCTARTKSAFLGASRDIAIVNGTLRPGMEKRLYLVRFAGSGPLKVLAQCI